MPNIYKRKPNRYSDNDKHASFGIKNWLIQKGLCVKEGSVHCLNSKQYTEVLYSYLEKYPSKKELKSMKQIESHIQKEFKKFTSFAGNLIKQNKIKNDILTA